MEKRLLKQDLFGSVWRDVSDDGDIIVRDTRDARWWTRWLARHLMRREAHVLTALEGLDGIPQIIRLDRERLVRSYIEGEPMYVAQPNNREFFTKAMRLLRRVHQLGVAHNDLAKEPNILIRPNGDPAFIDFQLARPSRHRGSLFRLAAREDIRHLLKHKRTYRPDLLTQRERRILDTPSLPSRIYRATIKPIYLFVTRRLLGWADREGAADRGRRN